MSSHFLVALLLLVCACTCGQPSEFDGNRLVIHVDGQGFTVGTLNEHEPVRSRLPTGVASAVMAPVESQDKLQPLRVEPSADLEWQALYDMAGLLQYRASELRYRSLRIVYPNHAELRDSPPACTQVVLAVKQGTICRLRVDRDPFLRAVASRAPVPSGVTHSTNCDGVVVIADPEIPALRVLDAVLATSQAPEVEIFAVRESDWSASCTDYPP